MRKICLSLLIFSLFLHSILASPGDAIIEEKCQKMGDRSFCVTLTEAEDCGLQVNLEVDRAPIMHQKLNHLVESEVCTPHKDYYNLDICVSLYQKPSDPSQLCLNAFVKGLNKLEISCFPRSRLETVKKCEDHYVPPTTVDENVFERCASYDNLPLSQVCGKLTFRPSNCSMSIAVGLEGLYRDISTFPITLMKGKLQDEENCLEIADFSACLNWKNLKLSDTEASGCGELVFSGPDVPTRTEPLGCFKDDKLVPACWGGCPNQCSGRGTCEKGVCQCVGRWSSDDCSVPPVKNCPNDCNSHGSCVNGVCHCGGGFSGADCSVRPAGSSESPNSQNESSGGNWRGTMVGLGIVVIIVAIAAAGFIGWQYYIRKKASQHQFNRLDLIDDDQDWEGGEI
eukprot:TRINITY_DN1751_c0_g2_i1.p1 TRINITY_DN1751_c0_g2~~TRINITY_DN1751_c0_g2_i1.p1  ORF type:complete len:397 (-),score=115.96 TRINITY_DN1751_c0_g2_i1:507-1697(-)